MKRLICVLCAVALCMTSACTLLEGASPSESVTADTEGNAEAKDETTENEQPADVKEETTENEQPVADVKEEATENEQPADDGWNEAKIEELLCLAQEEDTAKNFFPASELSDFSDTLAGYFYMNEDVFFIKHDMFTQEEWDYLMKDYRDEIYADGELAKYNISEEGCIYYSNVVNNGVLCVTPLENDFTTFAGMMVSAYMEDESLETKYRLKGACFYPAIMPEAVEASSSLPAGSESNYIAENLYDSDVFTAWVEGVPGNGEGQVLTYRLPAGTEIHGLAVVNGYGKNEKVYHANGAVKELMITALAGEFSRRMTLEKVTYTGMYNPLYPQCTYWSGVDADVIQVTIQSAEAGTDYEDTCISEMWFY